MKKFLIALVVLIIAVSKAHGASETLDAVGQINAEVVRNGESPKSAVSTVRRSGNTFSVEQTTKSDVETPYTWKDKDGKTYPIYISKKGARTSKSAVGTSGGSCYIKRISKKTGKEYKYYLSKETQEQIRKELGV